MKRIKHQWFTTMKNQKGLTLLELLAVILIMGILAAIVIPVVTGQGDSARISSHESNIESIESAAERYDFERSLVDEDFAILTESHPMVLEGYLPEVPENPWAGTNADYEGYEYILTKDARGVMHAYLADASSGSVTNIVQIEGEEDIANLSVGNAQSATDLYFQGDAETAPVVDDGEDVFLNYRYFFN